MAKVAGILCRCLVVNRELQPGEDSAAELDIAVRASRVEIGWRNQEVPQKARPSETKISRVKSTVEAITPEEGVQMIASSVGETAKTEERPFPDGH